jgi:hypothetical protein
MSEQHADLYEAHAGSVTAEEQQLLKEHEPLIAFRVLAGEGLSEGRQSRVSVLEYDRGHETYRVLWKRMGAGKGLTAAEAGDLHARLQPYRQDLIATGWQVPQLLYTTVTTLPEEQQIFSYEQFIPGGDGEKQLGNEREPNFRKWFLVDEVVRTLAQYPQETVRRAEVAGQELTRLPHGLDLKLANCVLEAGTNQLYFVDLFGPKELDERGQWLTFSTKLDSLPEEALLAVCATREGAILRCWRLAEQHWSNGSRSVEQLRQEFLARLPASALPEPEQRFIAKEIDAGYPWLDELYREYRV